MAHKGPKAYDGFRDKMRPIHFSIFLFCMLKHYILIIPTTDNFCSIAHIQNVDSRGNKSLQNYIDKEENQQFLPFISAF